MGGSFLTALLGFWAVNNTRPPSLLQMIFLKHTSDQPAPAQNSAALSGWNQSSLVYVQGPGIWLLSKLIPHLSPKYLTVPTRLFWKLSVPVSFTFAHKDQEYCHLSFSLPEPFIWIWCQPCIKIPKGTFWCSSSCHVTVTVMIPKQNRHLGRWPWYLTQNFLGNGTAHESRWRRLGHLILALTHCVFMIPPFASKALKEVIEAKMHIHIKIYILIKMKYSAMWKSLTLFLYVFYVSSRWPRSRGWHSRISTNYST